MEQNQNKMQMNKDSEMPQQSPFNGGSAAFSDNSVPKSNTPPSAGFFSKFTPASQKTAYGIPPVKKKLFGITSGDMVFIIIGVLLSIAGVSLTLWGGFHCGFTVTYISAFAYITAFCFDKTKNIGAFPLICGTISLLSSLVFTVTESPSVNFFLVIIMFMLSAVWFDSLNGSTEEKGDMGLVKNIFVTTVGTSCLNIPAAVRSVFAADARKKIPLSKILIGAVCALPVLFAVIPLLISSDAAFEGLAENIFGNVPKLILKVILGIIVSVFLISFCLGLKNGEKEQPLKSKFGGIDSVFIISFLSVLSACYILYLFSQLAYFFSAFSGILPEEYSFTAAGYARRGFVEMAIVSFINFTVIFSALLLSKKKDSKPSAAIRGLGVFIGIFTLIIIATAISKMFLYIERFGMTVLRIGTSAFMVFVALVFIFLIIRCFVPKVRVVRMALITASVILLVLGFGNLNGYVAKYNYDAYISGKLEKIDVYTIAKTGASGVPYLVKLAYAEDIEIANRAREQLEYYVFYDMYEIKNDEGECIVIRKEKDLGSWNFSEELAYKSFDRYIKDNPDFYNNESSYDYYGDYN